jgi:hypothetical protein
MLVRRPGSPRLVYVNRAGMGCVPAHRRRHPRPGCGPDGRGTTVLRPTVRRAERPLVHSGCPRRTTIEWSNAQSLSSP